MKIEDVFFPFREEDLNKLNIPPLDIFEDIKDINETFDYKKTLDKVLTSKLIRVDLKDIEETIKNILIYEKIFELWSNSNWTPSKEWYEAYEYLIKKFGIVQTDQTALASVLPNLPRIESLVVVLQFNTLKEDKDYIMKIRSLMHENNNKGFFEIIWRKRPIRKTEEAIKTLEVWTGICSECDDIHSLPYFTRV